jgi:hypothetical protein
MRRTSGAFGVKAPKGIHMIEQSKKVFTMTNAKREWRTNQGNERT